MNRVVASLALGLISASVVSLPALPVFTSDWRRLPRRRRRKPKAKTKAKQAGTKAAPKIASKGPPPRIQYTAEDAAAAVVPGFPDARVWGDTLEDFKKVLPPNSGPWLAMSGGGSDGAFAAGLLNGWTQAGKRPEFTVVTGVSIGALLAPYAFLGPKFDDELRRRSPRSPAPTSSKTARPMKASSTPGRCVV